MRVRRLLAATVVACAAATIPLSAAQGAQIELGGWLMHSTAGPIQLIFEAPSFGLPADPTAEFTVARTTAKSSVGTGYGLASVAWPGEFLANLPPVASDQVNDNFENNGGPRFFPELPGYPVRAETFYPQGPAQQSSGAEAVQMRATALEGESEGYSTGGDVVLPGLLEARRVVSHSRALVDGTRAITEASAAMQDVRILGGFITAKLITNTVNAASDGRTATAGGDFAIAGLRVGGTVPGIVAPDGKPIEVPLTDVTLDADGLHIGNDDHGPSRDRINEAGRALRDAGITLIAPEPIDVTNGASASRTHDGLMIVLEAGKLQPYLDQLPERVKEELAQRGIFFDQTVIITLGSVGASTNAALPFELPPPPVAPTTPPIPPPPPVVSFPPPAAPPTTTVPPQQPPIYGSVPVAAAIPLPAALAILVGLVGFLGTWALGSFADRVTAPRASIPDHH